MTKKLRSKSQFYPDLREFGVDLLMHSQIGEGYQLAQLGSVDELYDRLGKYDRDDPPLNRVVAKDSITYFLDRIGPCQFYDFDEAYELMDKSKSIGFGAQRGKIFSREDPDMYEYMKEYVKVSSETPHHVIVNASQKDEVRVITKTPRLFTAFPPEHTLLASMCLGDFVRQFLKHRFCVDHSISAVGDAMQNGAAAYYRYVMDCHPYTYCTDTSAQDSSISPDFIDMVYDEIKLKYDFTPVEESLFEAVRFNSINKMMNVNGDLYLVPRGLGSGDYLTTIINIMWRLYMVLENYNHDYRTFYDDNMVIINGDDLIMSSEYPDLDLNSRHAQIEWAGKPVPWSEMDFCSVKFDPYVHHDPNKVLAVLYHRKKKAHQLSPEFEMQRLGGLLRVLCNEQIYELVLGKMLDLLKKYPELEDSYDSLYISYHELYSNYNSPFRFD
jgi:hypothetical protein